jgi:hypothetical protein
VVDRKQEDPMLDHSGMTPPVTRGQRCKISGLEIVEVIRNGLLLFEELTSGQRSV